MARTGTGKGWEVHGNVIRQVFKYNGERYRIAMMVNATTPLEPNNPKSDKEANKIAAQIRKAIELDVFRFADFFPYSKLAENEVSQVPRRTFEQVCDLWLGSVTANRKKATLEQYKSNIKTALRIIPKDTFVDNITHQILAKQIGEYPWPSPDRHNKMVKFLRRIFRFEFTGEKMGKNPMTGIKIIKIAKKEVDPMSPIERDRILAYIQQNHEPRVYAYFLFAFYTGLRPGEQVALKWSDIDWENNHVRVERALSRGEIKTTKTGNIRDVFLWPEAHEALNIMKLFAPQDKRTTDPKLCFIFQNPRKNKPWTDGQAQARYWKPVFVATGIRYRTQYHTRHTFATWLLMEGADKSYLRKQLGHEHDSTMLEKHYTTWLEGQEAQHYQEKLCALIKTSKLERAAKGLAVGPEIIQNPQPIPKRPEAMCN